MGRGFDFVGPSIHRPRMDYESVLQSRGRRPFRVTLMSCAGGFGLYVCVCLIMQRYRHTICGKKKLCI